MPTTICLLTDFGHRDVYVGIMKGVMRSICPHADFVDLCHDVPPQNLLSGAYLLASAAPYMPTDCVMLGVVDPGVGSARRAIAARVGQRLLVGPDNGLFELLFERLGAPEAMVELTEPEYRLEPVSATFHGRDLFAPAAAHLASGVPLEELGEELDVEQRVRLELPKSREVQGALKTSVVHIDHFGNAITTLHGDELERWRAGAACSVAAGNDSEILLGQTFSDVDEGEPVAYVGSTGSLEVAVRGGSAAAQLGLEQHATISITRASS